MLARLGGDEFVLLLTVADAVTVVRERIGRALAAHNVGSSAGFELRLSIGDQVCDAIDTDSLEELVRRADAGTYLDKSSRPTRADGVPRLPPQRADDAAAPVCR